MAVTITSLHRDAKDGEITGIIVDKKHVNGLEMNSECVTFNHRLSVFSSPELKARWWAYSIGRLRSSVIRLSTFSNIFSSEDTGPIEVRFYVAALWVGGTRLLQTVMVTWPRWPPCPYMVKTLKNLLWNQKADDLETWYAALGTQVLPNSFKWWSWVDLDLFYGKVKFGPICFCMGKKVKQWIFQKLLSSMIWN